MADKEKKREYSKLMKCGHCGNTAPMIKATTYSTVELIEDPKGEAPPYQEGYVYDLLECPSCRKVILRDYYFADWMEDEEDTRPEILYPSSEKIPIGLSEALKKAYEAAQKVKLIDANAYGVLTGRLLEMICEDRNAKGKDLNSKLADLAAKGEIPNNLVGVANGLRILRNVGAHHVLGELTEREVPIVSSLTKAILEYVYSAPYLAKLASELLDNLKKKKAKKPKK